MLDGLGRSASAKIVGLGRLVEIEYLNMVEHERALEVHVVGPVPKGKRCQGMLEKFQELGVASWTPLETGRSVREAESLSRDKIRARLVESCKQCGCPWLLDVYEALSFGEVEGLRPRVALDASGQAWPQIANALKGHSRVHVLYGPEGGWSPEEMRMLSSGSMLRLSATTLRMETAAMLGAYQCISGLTP